MSRNFRAAGETGVAGTVDSATLLANGGFLVTGAKHAGGPLNSREIFDPPNGGFHVVAAVTGAPWPQRRRAGR